MRHYQQLNEDERFYIWNALRSGQTQLEVAKVLGRHPSTISREIKRNKYPQPKIYTLHLALEIFKWGKRRVATTKYRKLNESVATMILKLVRQYLSTEQVR